MGLTGSTHLNHAVVLYNEARATQRARELQEERESKAAKRRRRRRRGKCRTSSYIPRELRVRSILETLTHPLRWPSVRPAWLMGKKGKPLELDCFNHQLSIAFEADGLQHRKFIRHFQKDRQTFEAQKERDLLKDALCREHGVTLVRVPPRERVGDHDLCLWLMKALNKAGFNATNHSDRPCPRAV